MHTARICRISTDAKGRYAVTASTDKTVRVWELETGALLNVLRPPLSTGDPGKMYAVAMSPDGELIACAGYTADVGEAENLYIFERQSGRMRQRITGLPDTVNDLAFSPSGNTLAAAFEHKTSIRIWQCAPGTTTWVEKGRDDTVGDGFQSVDFSADGTRLVTCSDDRQLVLCSISAAGVPKGLKRTTFPANARPFSARFSPDGKFIAVGIVSAPRVVILNAATLELVAQPITKDIVDGDFSVVCWSLDGKFLYGGGRNRKPIQGKAVHFLRRWATGEWDKGLDTFAGNNSAVLNMRSLPEEGLLWCGSDGTWGMLDGKGDAIQVHRPPIGSFQGTDKTFGVTANGRGVGFSYFPANQEPARFDVIGRGADGIRPVAAEALPELKLPVTALPGVVATNWRDSFAPKVNGKALKLETGEMSRAMAIAPGGKRLLIGGDWYLRCFDSNGAQVWEQTAAEVVWAVNVSGDGRLAVAAFGDGTIRWYRMKDGKELLNLYPHPDRKRWVLWTPSGYYDCSTGGEDLIGWHVNNGPDQPGDFFAASRFRDTFYRPDVVEKILTTLDEAEAVRQANVESNRKPVLIAADTVQKRLPPVVKLLSPDNGTAVRQTAVSVRYSVRTPNGEPVTAVRLLVDGRPAALSRDLKLVSADGAERTGLVNIPEHDCTVAVIAENRFGSSEPAVVRLRWSGVPATDGFVIKPKLYVLAAGIADYANNKAGEADGGYDPRDDARLDLAYPAKDAKDFAAVLQAQQGGLYRDVEVKILTDKWATKDALLDGLEWIREQATARDVAMIFLSGHGVNDTSTGVFYFAPYDFNPWKMLRTGLAQDDIQNTIKAIAGKTLFFLDSCHSGNVLGSAKSKGMTADRGQDITAIVNELAGADNGAIVFAASTGSQVSLEDEAWGNGAFTKAVVEGLGGGADYGQNGRITVNMLDLFVAERVKQLTRGRQTPTTTKPVSVPDFPIAVKR